MAEQIDLYFKIEAGKIEKIPGPDNDLPLPDEDLEATGYQVKPVNRPVEGDHEPKAGRQGKCPTCRECYRWHSRRPLRAAHCPACGTKLQATTHLNRWPWNEGVEPLTAVQAWAKFKGGR